MATIPPRFLDGWTNTLQNNSNRDDFPFYNSTKALVSLSQIESLRIGTGESLYTQSLIPALYKARSEIILVTCFLARSSSLTQLGIALQTLAEARRSSGEAQRSTLRVRICFSSCSAFQKLFHTTSRDGHVYPPSKLPGLGLPSPDLLAGGGIDLRVKSLFFLPLSVMHPKFLVVDRKRAWVPSCNISWERWLEGVVEVRGGVVDSLLAFYSGTWGRGDDGFDIVAGDIAAPATPQTSSINADILLRDAKRSCIRSPADAAIAQPSGAAVPTILLPSSHHRNPHFRFLPWQPAAPAPDTPLNAALLHLFAIAERSVYVQTPNLTSEPVLVALLTALARGVDVHVVTSRSMMWLEQLVTAGTTTERRIRSLARRYQALVAAATATADTADVEASLPRPGRLSVDYFHFANSLGSCAVRIDGSLHVTKVPGAGEPVQSHLKMTIVDEAYVVLGSGNMDRASWYTSQELGILFYSTELAAELKRTVIDGVLAERKVPRFPPAV